MSASMTPNVYSKSTVHFIFWEGALWIFVKYFLVIIWSENIEAHMLPLRIKKFVSCTKMHMKVRFIVNGCNEIRVLRKLGVKKLLS